MNVRGTCGRKRLHAPLHGVLHGGRARNAAADFVRQAPQIVLQRRWLESRLNYPIDITLLARIRCCEKRGENANKEQGLHSSHMGVN